VAIGMVATSRLAIRKIVQGASLIVCIADGLRDTQGFLVQGFGRSIISGEVIGVGHVIGRARGTQLVTRGQIDFFGLFAKRAGFVGIAQI